MCCVEVKNSTRHLAPFLHLAQKVLGGHAIFVGRTAPNLYMYNTQKVQILLTKLRATVGTNKESENTSQWQREPKHIFLHWRRTRKCGPKKFPTEIDEKTTKTPISVGNFFGPHFRVRRQ